MLNFEAVNNLAVLVTNHQELSDWKHFDFLSNVASQFLTKVPFLIKADALPFYTLRL